MDVNTGLVLALLNELWGTAQHVRRGSDSLSTDPVRVRLLMVVEQRRGARPLEIAEALGIAHPSVSRHVRALEDSGEVTTVSNPDDGRSYRVHVTDQGRASLARFQDDLVARFAPALEGWSDVDTEQLTALLGRLNAAMATTDAQRRGKQPGRNRWRADS